MVRLLAVWSAWSLVHVGSTLWDSYDEDAGNITSRMMQPGCVDSHYRALASQGLPRRWYQYYHEDLEAAPDFQWRIIGGNELDIVSAPYTVLYGPYCGGTLIAPDWVITAAHCRTKDQYIIAGSTRISEGLRYDICAHFVHPLWDSPNKDHFHDFDYMLLLLKQPVPVTARSRPIAIGRPGDVAPGALVTITGWGHTKVKQKTMQDILRQVSVPIMSNEECRTMNHKYYRNVTGNMFCAGYLNGTKDSCQGDSGGPAMSNNKLVGMVSFGVGCAEREKPGVYSNVPAARVWIREVTGLPL